MARRHRLAISLIELLIVIAILAVLISLILVAVQQVREAALRTKSMNNLRQIMLATTQYADQNGGVIRNLNETNRHSQPTEGGGWTYPLDPNAISLYYELLPWTFGPRPPLKPGATPEETIAWIEPIVPMYTSPADPSVTAEERQFMHGNQLCSYAANLQVFHGTLALPAGVPDGLSSTIAFGERYAICKIQGEREVQSWGSGNPALGPFPYRFSGRRASFADPGSFDVVPVATRSGQTLASQPGLTFQMKPRVEQADGKQLQTPFRAGLPVALFDGSVRILSPSIAEPVFWGAVTPSGGEVLGDW